MKTLTRRASDALDRFTETMDEYLDANSTITPDRVIFDYQALRKELAAQAIAELREALQPEEPTDEN